MQALIPDKSIEKRLQRHHYKYDPQDMYLYLDNFVEISRYLSYQYAINLALTCKELYTLPLPNRLSSIYYEKLCDMEKRWSINEQNR